MNGDGREISAIQVGDVTDTEWTSGDARRRNDDARPFAGDTGWAIGGTGQAVGDTGRAVGDAGRAGGDAGRAGGESRWATGEPGRAQSPGRGSTRGPVGASALPGPGHPSWP
ncbi:hypothetical protein ND748_32025, partial [Frankia sp. AiPs1]|nr:hypothetical protein [Frankia sp. AiPs1]